MSTHDTIIRVAHMLSQGPEVAPVLAAWLGLPMYAVNDALADLMRLGYAEPWGDCYRFCGTMAGLRRELGMNLEAHG